MCLPAQVKRAGEHALRVQPALDRLLHGLPDPCQVVPDVLSLALLDVLPQRPARPLRPREDVRHRAQVVDAFGRSGALLVHQRAAADAVDAPPGGGSAVPVERLQEHPVRVKRQDYIRLPDNVHGARLEGALDDDVSQVPPARRGEAAIERDPKARGAWAARGEHLRGPLRSHRVTARWSRADAVEFFQRFHRRARVYHRGVALQASSGRESLCADSRGGILSPP